VDDYEGWAWVSCELAYELLRLLEQSRYLESLTTSQWEFPDEFNRTVLDFLKTVSEAVTT
jgi:hypothetical protein